MLNDDIFAADFPCDKVEAVSELSILESKISNRRSNNMSLSKLEKMLASALANLTAIDK